MFSAGKLGDAAIIASMDRDHYAQAMKALDLGYDLLLEKPISPDPRECMEIERKAAQKGRRVAVCHVLRYPYASANNWGLYNDMFGDVGASDTFRDYFISGCTDMPHATPDQVQQSKMPDFWQYGYSGGEFAEGNVRKWIDDEAIAETLRLIRESHSSLIGPCAPTDILEDQEDAHAFDANIDAIRWQMGYQLSLESLTRIDNATAGEELTLKLTWLNRGVAPFYYHWPLQWALVNEQGEAALTQAGQTDVRSLLPGRVGITETLALPKDLARGDLHPLLVLPGPRQRPARPAAEHGRRGKPALPAVRHHHQVNFNSNQNRGASQRRGIYYQVGYCAYLLRTPRMMCPRAYSDSPGSIAVNTAIRLAKT